MTAGGDGDGEGDYRAAARPTLELELAGTPRSMFRWRWTAMLLGVLALGVVVDRAVPSAHVFTDVAFEILALGILLRILVDASNPRPLRLRIARDEVVLENTRGRRIARCRRDDLLVTLCHAQRENRDVTLQLAIGKRRLRLGPAGKGYSWRVETKPGPRAEYFLGGADWLALLDALALGDQAVFPELEE